jgi:hypothetical protein
VHCEFLFISFSLKSEATKKFSKILNQERRAIYYNYK